METSWKLFLIYKGKWQQNENNEKLGNRYELRRIEEFQRRIKLLEYHKIYNGWKNYWVENVLNMYIKILILIFGKNQIPRIILFSPQILSITTIWTEKQKLFLNWIFPSWHHKISKENAALTTKFQTKISFLSTKL